MLVKRAKLSWLERLYFPALLGGLKITWRHFARTLFKKAVTMEYPEQRHQLPAGYRGAPYLVKDPDGNTKCVSCQLCEFVCPPKAIKIIPPGPDGQPPDRANAEKMPREFEINMLRCIFCGFCQEVCPEEAIFLKEDYSLVGLTRGEMIYNKEKLLQLGGTHHGPIKKWEQKLREARAQEAFPVKQG
ncbi:MAG TPA: NADH-quinone oxidoreductase subunit D [Verrucomicrobiales bacterium]|nr:NADH-quinone oxidoreductase subunit D [Verrucomicrobiales bacterium]